MMKSAHVYLVDAKEPLVFESEQISCEHINGCVRLFTKDGIYIFPSERVVYIYIENN